MHPRAQAIIHSLQPYRRRPPPTGPGDYSNVAPGVLKLLQELTNRDKHRRLNLLGLFTVQEGFAVSLREDGVLGPTRFRWPRPGERGTVIHEWNRAASTKVDMHVKFAPRIGLMESASGGMDGYAMTILQFIRTTIEAEVVPTLRPFL